MHNAITLASVDLGSNSFRLEIGSYEHQQIHRVEYLKEAIRQGNGLDADRNLTAEALERGWECLARFGERLRGFDPAHVSAVATQTLREARNRDLFIERGSALLGFPIDVITGEQEARLIYRGVVSQLPATDERRLVMDIGGRSTELILGHRHVAEQVASYRLGSVAWSGRCFPQGALTQEAFAKAELAAAAVLDEALDTFRPGTWDVAYASAGTANAVGDILAANGFAPGTIDRAGLDWLLDQLLRAQSVDRIRLDGLKEDRRPVLAGGISIMRAAFDLLGLERMQIAMGALRQGALHGLIDQELPTGDARHASVRALMSRFSVHSLHAQHVADTAAALWQQLGASPQATQASPPDRLVWAAQLHEVGCRIARASYHRHSAYILENTDAKGFSSEELRALSQLVLGHRGKIRKVEPLLEKADDALQLLALRLAALLCHARVAPDLQGLALQRRGNRIQLRTSRAWAERFPRSVYLLREEAEAWSKTAWPLELQID